MESRNPFWGSSDGFLDDQEGLLLPRLSKSVELDVDLRFFEFVETKAYAKGQKSSSLLLLNAEKED